MEAHWSAQSKERPDTTIKQESLHGALDAEKLELPVSTSTLLDSETGSMSRFELEISKETPTTFSIKAILVL